MLWEMNFKSAESRACSGPLRVPGPPLSSKGVYTKSYIIFSGKNKAIREIEFRMAEGEKCVGGKWKK